MQCVSLFSGAGGLDLGFRAAGIDVLAAVELDADCCATLRHNGARHVHEGDVIDWSLPRIDPSNGPLVLIGGPPCQPFSKSAYWSRVSAQGLADRRASSLGLYFDVLTELRPDAFLIENVEGFVTAGGVQFVEAQLDLLRRAGIDYHFNWRVLNCADYGVPQKRRRFFGVGSRAFQYNFPQPTHGSRDNPYITAWDALHGRRSSRNESLAIKGQWADLVATIPEGKNYLWHTARGGGVELFGWRTRYWSFLQKLAKTEPSPTIVATPAQESGPFHWNNRQLSTGELAALQTFPKGYRFAGNQASRRRQIGNAVPPLMAEVLAKSLLRAFGMRPGDDLAHEVLRASVAAPPSRVQPVPGKFLRLAGPRNPHPGTGKGPSPRIPKQPAEALAEPS